MRIYVYAKMDFMIMAKNNAIVKYLFNILKFGFFNML